MTLISGSSEADIDASLDACWAVLEDVERSPEWQQGLERVTVVERDDAGRPLVCDTISDAKFTKVRCRVSVAYAPPHRLTIIRLESDDVDVMESSWELTDAGDGRTHAVYRLAVDPGAIPRFARPLERALRPVLLGRRAEELRRAVTGRA